MSSEPLHLTGFSYQAPTHGMAEQQIEMSHRSQLAEMCASESRGDYEVLVKTIRHSTYKTVHFCRIGDVL